VAPNLRTSKRRCRDKHVRSLPSFHIDRERYRRKHPSCLLAIVSRQAFMGESFCHTGSTAGFKTKVNEDRERSNGPPPIRVGTGRAAASPSRNRNRPRGHRMQASAIRFPWLATTMVPVSCLDRSSQDLMLRLTTGFTAGGSVIEVLPGTPDVDLPVVVENGPEKTFAKVIDNFDRIPRCRARGSTVWRAHR